MATATDNLFDRVRKDGKRVLLAFSCGKDSLCAWVVLRDAGFEVVPAYRAWIPGLEFMEHTLRYYEDFFGTHIYRVQHPTLYVWLKTLTATPQHRKDVIELLNLPHFGFDDTNAGVKRTAGLPKDCWTAIATRRADSLMRRQAIPANGFNERAHEFFPVADYNKDDLIRCLKGAGVKLPKDYELFGRSWDGLQYRYLAQIKQHYPRDYAKILEWFPMQGMELFRAVVARRHGQDRAAAEEARIARRR